MGRRDAHIIWQAGDPWRDLIDGMAGPVAVVTWNGTVRLLDLASRRQMRIPRSSNLWWNDRYERPLLSIDVATPCGLVLVCSEAPGDWEATTPVRQVLALHEAVADVTPPDRSMWSDDGHPTRPCGALYCSRLGN